jgi:hypothetical protein
MAKSVETMGAGRFRLTKAGKHHIRAEHVHAPGCKSALSLLFICYTSLHTVIFKAGSVLWESGKKAFLWSELKGSVIPESVSEIGKYVFVKCKRIESVVFEARSALWEIRANAFVRNRIFIPTSVGLIGEGALLRCRLFESVAVGTISPFLCRVGRT